MLRYTRTGKESVCHDQESVCQEGIRQGVPGYIGQK